MQTRATVEHTNPGPIPGIAPSARVGPGCPAGLCGGALPALSGCARQGAKPTEMLPNESVVRVPVQVALENGGQAGRAGRHRVHAQGEGRHPLMVISHGRRRRRRPRQAGPRAYATAARYFTDAGFVVAVPVRLGYGATGGPDLENSGPCGDRRFTPMFNRAASEIAQVIEAMARRPDVDPANVVALGQSVGGGSTVALAAARPAGVRAPPSISRAARAAIRSIAGQALRTRALAGNLCRLRRDHPHAHALDLYRERPVLGPNGRGAGPRPTTPPAAMRIRTPGAGRRQRPLAVHACAREMETAGARLPARAGLRHAGAGRAFGQARRP